TFDQNAAAAGDYWGNLIGAGENGAVFTGNTPILWFALICFVVNFVLIYRGISKGIEVFCKVAMPLLILFAIAMLVRVLTLEPYTDADGATRTVSDGLGFMWNPDWKQLGNASVWLAAAGQIFFSLSVGFGIILTYASYLKKDDDVVLSGLTATSMNEFCEVILGGMICVPAAFIFLGQDAASQGTFGLGFSTMPAIFDFMPGGTGQIFGAIWFGLLFLAAVTSSVSMLQPAIAFLEEGFALNRKQSVTLLGGLTIVGAGLIIYFSKGAAALDAVDFWVGTFLIFILASGQVILFGWIYGAEKGRQEANRGAEIRIPAAFSFVIKYVTPAFLIAVFVLWCFQELPKRIAAMTPGTASAEALASNYQGQFQAALGLDKAEEGSEKEKALKTWSGSVSAEVEKLADVHDASKLEALATEQQPELVGLVLGADSDLESAVRKEAVRFSRNRAASARKMTGAKQDIDPRVVFAETYRKRAEGLVDEGRSGKPSEVALKSWQSSLVAGLANHEFTEDNDSDLESLVAGLDSELFAALTPDESVSGWDVAVGQNAARVAGQKAAGAAEGAVTQRTTSILLILVLIGFVLVTNAAGRLWKKQGHEPGGALKSSQ
ncbi:MAG: hypothetical protein RL885_02040, partial [Planctomycetota bacterium]